MQRDKPEPISDAHVEFAHALVALARRYEADALQVSFRLSGGRRFFEDRTDYQQVQFAWHEGRHGERSGFTLKAEASVQIDERDDAQPTPVSDPISNKGER